MNGDQLLEHLEAAGKKYGMKWVCRESTTGRGLRLHQTSSLAPDGTHDLSGRPVFDSPREALLDFALARLERKRRLRAHARDPM